MTLTSAPTPRVLRTLAAVCVGLVALLSFAAEPAKQTFDLPAGDAESTLKLFTQQSGEQILYPPARVSGVTTNAVKGEMTSADALDLMLAQTSLIAVRDPKTRAFTIQKALSVEDAEKNGARAIASSDRPERDRREAQYETDEQGNKVLKLDTFEVFGRKTLNMDVRRTRDDIQPYVVFDRKAIERSGASSINDFLRTRLSMNTVAGASSDVGNPNFTTRNSGNNQSAVDLRGMGTRQTLILVDGRRLPEINNGSGREGGVATQPLDLGQPDINGIPLAAIERVEVLPSTASGIYGGSATGGVINIVLKRDYRGIELSGTYGNTFDAATETKELSVVAGISLRGGQTRLMLTTNLQSSTPMQVGDRPFGERLRAAQVLFNPSAQTAAPPAGYTTNIKSQTNVPLVLDTGTALNSIFTSIPVGYAGVQSDNGAALVARAGIYNQSLPNQVGGGGLRTDMRNGTDIKSAAIALRHELGKIEVYADAAINRNEGRILSASYVAAAGNRVNIPANAPNNPFQQAITVTFPTPNLAGVYSFSTSETRRALAGVIARLPGEWVVSADYGWSQSEVWSYGPNSVGETSLLTSVGQTALTNGTLDVMRDVNAFPVDYSPYIAPNVTARNGPFVSNQDTYALRFGGPVVDRMQWSISLSGNVERREIVAEGGFAQVAGASTYTYWQERSQEINSGYVETRTKITSSLFGGSKSSSLEFLGSVRSDRYLSSREDGITAVTVTAPIRPALTVTQTKNRSTDYTIGVRWAPIQDLSIRVSTGTGFLPPSVSQISIPTPETIAAADLPSRGFIDPKRGNTLVGTDSQGNTLLTNLSLLTGGNPALLPEDSRNESVGIILTPRLLPRFRFSIDYTKIRKRNEVVNLLQQEIIDIEDYAPDRIVRGPRLPSDPASWLGPITSLNYSAINRSGAEVEAVDFQADYSLDLNSGANLSFYAAATRQIHLKRQFLPISPWVESAGYRGGPLEWKGNVGASFEHGRWTIGWNMQYYHDQKVFSENSSSVTRDLFTRLNAGKPVLRHQSYHDLFLRYDWGASASREILQNLSVTLAVQNLLNTEPPFYSGTGYSGYGDPRLGRFTLTVKKAL